jgi:hypothetical protein
MRLKRLSVKARKDARKLEIVNAGADALSQHIRTLNAAMPRDYMPAVHADFAGATRGLKSLDSMQSKVSDELARAKIAANEIATRIHLNITAIEDSKLVVHDMAALVLKAPEDLANVLAVRKADQERREAEARERIRAEEQAKAEKAARERLEQEQREAAAAQQRETERQAEIALAAVVARQAPAVEATHAAMRTAIETGTGITRTTMQADGLPVVEHIPVANVVPMPTKAPAVDTSARIKLGDLNAAIAPLSITADGLAALGFPVVATDKTSKLYRLADMPGMLAAMVAHIQAVQEKQAA